MVQRPCNVMRHHLKADHRGGVSVSNARRYTGLHSISPETLVQSFLIVCHTFKFVTCDLFDLSLVPPLCFRLFCDVT